MYSSDHDRVDTSNYLETDDNSNRVTTCLENHENLEMSWNLLSQGIVICQRKNLVTEKCPKTVHC